MLVIASTSQLSFTAMPFPTHWRPVLVQMGQMLTHASASAVASAANQNQKLNSIVTLQLLDQFADSPEHSTVAANYLPRRRRRRDGIESADRCAAAAAGAGAVQFSTACPPPNVLTSPHKRQVLESSSVPTHTSTNTPKISLLTCLRPLCCPALHRLAFSTWRARASHC